MCPPLAEAPSGAPGGPDLGAIAQLVERLNGIQEVSGSTPLSSTNPGQDRADAVLAGAAPQASVNFNATPLLQ